MASITKRNNSYLLKAFLGYDQQGKQIVKSKTWRIPEGLSSSKAKSMATRMAQDFEDKLKGGYVVNTQITVGEFIDNWLARGIQDRKLKDRTVESYTAYALTIKQIIGHVKMQNVNDSTIRYVLDSIKAEHYVEKFTLKPSWADKYGCINQSKIAAQTNLSSYMVKNIIGSKEVSVEAARAFSEAIGSTVSHLFKKVVKSYTLSGKTIVNYYRFLSVLFQDAKYDKLLEVNPLDYIRPPKFSQAEAMCLQPDQAKQLYDALQSEDVIFRGAVSCALLLGMRRGEILGLQFGDLDFDCGLIRVTRAISYTPAKGVYVSTPKTEKSKRPLAVPESLLAIFREIKKYQQTRRDYFGKDWNPEGWIFSDGYGNVIRPDTFSSKFKKFSKKNGLPDIHLHNLRHTNASVLISNGVDLQTVAHRLGHASVNTTLKVYSHVIAQADALAAEKVDDFFTKQPK